MEAGRVEYKLFFPVAILWCILSIPYYTMSFMRYSLQNSLLLSAMVTLKSILDCISYYLV